MPVRTIVFGDSLIRRTESYCEAHHVFDDSVKFIGQEGLKVSSVPDQLLRELEQFEPRTVISHLGGNDIGNHISVLLLLCGFVTLPGTLGTYRQRRLL